MYIFDTERRIQLYKNHHDHKKITAKEVFKLHPEVKKQLWGGEFWTDGCFVNTVSRFGDETTISKYVKEQGVEKEYKVLHRSTQPV